MVINDSNKRFKNIKIIMSKTISAVITLYNKAELIGKTLESLLLQPVDFKEIIVVDDGSNDDSAKIIKEFSANHKNIKYVFQENQGVAGALNTGLKIASGDFVAVLDDDVVLDENWILKLMLYFSSAPGGEKVAAVSGLTKIINPKNIWAALAGYNVEYRQSKMVDEFVDHLSTTNTIYRKSVLDGVGLFDTNFRYGQDNELSYRIMSAGYKLVLSHKTFCLHFWPESFMGFMKQRLHGAYARMMLIKKYPKRWSGDKISSLRYFLELPLGIIFLLSLVVSLAEPDFLIFAGIMFFVIHIFQFDEIKFFIKNKKIFIGVFMPFFILLRSIAWISGIIKFYLV